MDNQEERGSGEETDQTSTTSGSSTDSNGSESSTSTTSKPHVDRITEPTDQPFGPIDQLTTTIQTTENTQSTPRVNRPSTSLVNQPTTSTQIPTEPTRRPQTTRQSSTSRRPIQPVTSNCRDIAINCQFQLQYCRSAAAAMKVYCQYSCGFCDK